MEFFSTYWRSFWSPLAYKNALEWKWKIFFYFILLSLFSSVIVSISTYKVVNDFFENELNRTFAEFVPFEIVDGHVKTPEEKLYTYKLDNGFPLLAISEKPQSDSSGYFLCIEGNELIVDGEGQMRSFDISTLFMSENMTVDRTYIDRLILFYRVIANICIIPALFILILLSNAFYVLILGTAAYMMTSTSPFNLGFVRCLKIAVLAITPMVALQSFASIFLIEDSAGFLYGLISIGLVWYVIKKLPAYIEEDSPLRR